VSVLKLSLSRKALIPQDIDLGVKMTRKTDPKVLEASDCCLPCFSGWVASALEELISAATQTDGTLSYTFPDAGTFTFTGTFTALGDFCEYTPELHYSHAYGEGVDPPAVTLDVSGTNPSITISGDETHIGGTTTVWLTWTHPDDSECVFIVGPRILISSAAVAVPLLWAMAEQAFLETEFEVYNNSLSCEVSFSGVCLVLVSPTDADIDYANFSWGIATYDTLVFDVSETTDGSGRPVLCISLLPAPGSDPGGLCEYIGSTFVANPTYDFDGAGANLPESTILSVNIEITA
jgi:hypothetical protein